MLAPLPVIKSFLIADQVFRQDSGKWCVIGIFERIRSAHYPMFHHTIGLFVQLSDAEGDYTVRLDFCRSGGQVLAQMDGIKLSIRDRLARVGFGIQTVNLPIPEPGRYYLKLFFDGREAASDITVDADLMGDRAQ